MTDEIFGKLPRWSQEQVEIARARQAKTTEKLIKAPDRETLFREPSKATDESRAPGTGAVVNMSTKGDADSSGGMDFQQTLALAARAVAWPEGKAARKGLVEWCREAGVPAP